MKFASNCRIICIMISFILFVLLTYAYEILDRISWNNHNRRLRVYVFHEVDRQKSYLYFIILRHANPSTYVPIVSSYVYDKWRHCVVVIAEVVVEPFVSLLFFFRWNVIVCYHKSNEIFSIHEKKEIRFNWLLEQHKARQRYM